MKFKILLLFLLTLLLQSCMFSGTKTVANKEIDMALRETMRAKNDSLLNALSNSDMKAFQKLGSPEFLKHLRANIDNVVWGFRKGFLDTKFDVYNEYYNQHSQTYTNTQIVNEKDSFTFMYKNTTKESYVSFLKVVYNGMDDYLVTTIHELIDGKWKLTSVSMGTFGIFGKNAEEFFQMAKQKKEEGYLIDAFNYVNVAKSCLEPSGNKLKYDNEERILYYFKIWQDELRKKYPMPNTLNNIRTSPQVVLVDPIKNAEGLYPMFKYLTQIPLTDAATLAEENELIKREVRKQYPDIDFSSDYVYYTAYNSVGSTNSRVFKEVNK